MPDQPTAVPPAVKFAVVREDPRIDLAIARRHGASRALMVASGGCTAFAFAEALPGVELTLYDMNPAQLAHVDARADAIARGDLQALNVGAVDRDALGQCGEFERLFRVLRTAILELVAPDAVAWFRGAGAHHLPERWFANPYWPVAFTLAFHDDLLVTMFGPDAVQHAEPGSYPSYFQGVFERGLRARGARQNPFLQHVFLQHYRTEHAPSFLRMARKPAYRAILGSLPALDLTPYDFVHVSNIFDWSDDGAVAEWAEALRALEPGAVVVIRQLNNTRDLARFLAPWFELIDETALQERDRSLFYNRIISAVRTQVPA